MWAPYIKKRGSLNVGLRVEMSTGQLAWIVHSALGGKSKLDVFMPNVVRQEQIIEDDLPNATVEDFKLLMGVKNP